MIQVVIGLRQVGKTTTTQRMLEAEFKDQCLFYSVDEIFNATPEWIMEIWQEAKSSKKIEHTS